MILLLIVSSLLVNTNKFYDKNSRYYRFLLNYSTFFTCVFARIRLHVTGMDKVPKGTRFVLVGNHVSKFDPILSWFVFRKFDVAYISKPENFKVPAFGRIIRKCCFLAIDRDDPRKSMMTLHEATELIKKDEVSIGVYPEGTRGPGDELLPFHNGVFHIAKMGNVPIIVLAVRNTADIAKNFPKRRTHVYLDVVDVIDVDYVMNNKTTVIGERVRAALNDKIYNKGDK